MILDSITLHDFGAYAGRQRIDLAPPSPGRPIVLVGGLNGGGKTTLLDALRLVLFGQLANTSNRASIPYTEYLDRSIHRHSVHGEASLSLSFRHYAEGLETRYEIRRSWRRTKRGVKESFSAIRNGVPDYLASANWAARVETFMPVGIAHLFLFDGERIESYADPEKTSELIESAILNLLGLGIVDQLAQDLKVFERRKRAESKDGPETARIQHVEKEVERARERLSILRGHAAKLNTRISCVQRDAERVEHEFRAAGGTLYELRAELEAGLQQVRSEVSALETKLLGHAAGALPLVLANGLLDEAVRLASDERAARREALIVGALEDRDAAALALLRERELPDEMVVQVESLLAADRAARKERSELGIRLDLQDDVPGKLDALRENTLDEAFAAAEADILRYSKNRTALTSGEEQLAHIPDEDSIAPLMERRNRLQDELAALEKRRDRNNIEVGAAQDELERLERTLADLQQVDAKARFGQHEKSRLVVHSVEARSTISEFRRRVIEQNVEHIEHLVLECFQQLLRKTSLVGRIVVDPESFALSLFAPDGARFDPRRLSAGERQLLAVATLWGLGKASGRALPAVIDTPLGRLDGTHREYLVQRYFPNVSHQVLLLSTDEEISQPHLRTLEPWIGHRYRLDYDDSTEATTVSRGYFEHEDAA